MGSRWYKWGQGNNGTGRVKCGNVRESGVEDRLLGGTIGTNDFQGRSHLGIYYYKSFLNPKYAHIRAHI